MADFAERLLEDLERGLPEFDGWLPETGDGDE